MPSPVLPPEDSDRDAQRKQDETMIKAAAGFVGRLLWRNKKWIGYLALGGVALLILSQIVWKLFGVILVVSVVGGVAYLVFKIVRGNKETDTTEE